MSKISYQGRLDPQMDAALLKQAELTQSVNAAAQSSLDDIRKNYNQERRYWNEDAPELSLIQGEIFPGPHGEIPVRCYYPVATRPLPALVYVHGGGWVVGNLDTHDKIMRLLALHSKMAVVGVDYRLSPEHRFPIALEETIAVVKYLSEFGEKLGIDSSRLAIGGDSAGANLSIAAALQLRNLGHRDLVKLLLLYYGMYGLRDSCSRRLFGGLEDGMSDEDLALYLKAYIRGPEDMEDIRFNVLNADLQGAPPCFIGAAEYDPLIDDSRTLKAMLDEVGVQNELAIYPGVLHGFLHHSRIVDKAAQALIDGAAALKRVFSS
ncbi:MAG: alpha/beta hydrolase fold domain-containing protein [Deltaproteobacteria bacterium]|nr:alpha/beta hydrolase fold domain-containing protein [Deltaproteobacteria bacterium]